MTTHALYGHQNLSPESVNAGEGSSLARTRGVMRYEQDPMPSINHVLPRESDGRFPCSFVGCYESFERRSELQ